jgi:16S rRNA (uracil1498-N3)-methyltransferase
MIPRLYCPSLLAFGAAVDLPESAAHHARRVLRLDAGDAVTLFDGQGAEFAATLLAGNRALVGERNPVDCEAPIRVTLAQALPAADKMDWLVQKAVELGVAAVQPLAARRCVVRLAGERAERRIAHWQQVAVAACEQCGRNRVPVVAPLRDLPHYLGETVVGETARLLLSPDAGVRLSELPPPRGAVTLLVGPEGGFEDGEVLAAAAAGFTALRLGPRVLRTETAGLAALAAMMALWGDY